MQYYQRSAHRSSDSLTPSSTLHPMWSLHWRVTCKNGWLTLHRFPMACWTRTTPSFRLPSEWRLHLGRFQARSFSWRLFPPVEIPVVAHTPWVQRNIPILPGIYDEVCRIIRVKMDAGVYERSNSSYRSRWFCIVKKDTMSLCLIHSLEPLNAVTIQHSGITPFTEQIAEQIASRACSGILDLYIGYNERALVPSSCNYTTFQTPYGMLRLTKLLMGWTNMVPIFHDNITHILQPEVPKYTIPYIDNVPIHGPTSTYQDNSGE